MAADPQITPDAVAAVLDALARPTFRWRTIVGVSKDTGLATDIVLRALSIAAGQIIKSSVPSADGQDLYTTRGHFRETASVAEKLLGAIRNRAE